MSSLPDTQTQSPDTLTPTSGNCLDSYVPIDIKSIWGMLYPLRPNFERIDLNGFVTTIGRGDKCQVRVTTAMLSAKQLGLMSKIHFVITKDKGQPAYIQDMSKNGTYVNKKRLGKGKQVLQNDNEIGIGLNNFSVSVFIYKNLEPNACNTPKEILQKYETSRIIGKGSCGEVRLVFDKYTCERYAMKKISVGKLVNKKPNALTNRHKILNEIDILKSLSYPCIVQMVDMYSFETEVYIVMEYMEGGELYERIKSAHKQPENVVKFLFYQVTLAVQYLHNKQVTHRDLKPENILLKSHAPETLVKVADFGLSKIVGEENVMKTLCGTPTYVAPEILLNRGKESYTKQVDIWSLGVILYFSLSQQLPFIADDRSTLNAMITQGVYSFDANDFKNVSECAKSLIKRMLTCDVKNRITVDEILYHPWINEDYKMLIKANTLIGKTTENFNVLTDDDEPTSGHLEKRGRLELSIADTLSKNS